MPDVATRVSGSSLARRSILCVVALGWACGSSAPSDGRDPAAMATQRVLLDALAHRERAGGFPAPSSDGELGIVSAASISPDGRWIVVRDEVAPAIKIIDSLGTVRRALHAVGDTTDDYLAPTVAISNHRLLVVWSDSTRAGLLDLDGREVESVRGVDFVPLAATALSDSVWFVYGPSRGPVNGRVAWVHCLYTAASGSYWRSALLDSGAVELDSLSDPVLSVSDAEVRVDHRKGAGAEVVGARCGDGREAPSAAVIATGEGGPAETADARPRRYAALSATNGFHLLAWGDSLALVGRGHERPNLTALIRRRPVANVTLVRPLDSARVAPTIVLPNSYQLLHSRRGVGVLIGVATPMPRLALVDGDALTRALHAR